MQSLEEEIANHALADSVLQFAFTHQRELQGAAEALIIMWVIDVLL